MAMNEPPVDLEDQTKLVRFLISAYLMGANDSVKNPQQFIKQISPKLQNLVNRENA